MSKRRIELLPNNSNSEPTSFVYGEIIRICDDGVVIQHNNGVTQFIPKYRFIKEEDKTNLCLGAMVKVNNYFKDATRKKLLAYNAELTSE